MNWKKHLLHGILAGILAAMVGMIYLTIYQKAFELDYEKVINVGSIAGSSIFGTVLMALGYGILQQWKAERFTGVLNIAISVLSFASIIGPISMELPLDVESPELFPGLAVPMHFFPALAFLTIAPFFKNKTEA